MNITRQELTTFRHKCTRVRQRYGMGGREAALSVVRLLAAFTSLSPGENTHAYLQALCHLGASVWDGTISEYRAELTLLAQEYTE